MDSFLCPTLSLPTQLEMEKDRRAAARMSRDQLAEKMDEMIQTWYMQQAMINEMLGAIRQLQVKVALAGDPKPAKREPEQRHVEWARELMGWR
jgi:crotonobetainyl-CoA:carnitine CoA-transferase CaiB-like acyl-CoA transferase